MHSEPGRYINSVSDLYETDEIEFLLEEIRDLEPTSCKPEDIQVKSFAWSCRFFGVAEFTFSYFRLCKVGSTNKDLYFLFVNYF